jgi:hypothetical protein
MVQYKRCPAADHQLGIENDVIAAILFGGGWSNSPTVILTVTTPPCWIEDIFEMASDNFKQTAQSGGIL